MAFLKHKSKGLLGLDIGTSAVKAVELARHDQEIRLKRAQMAAINPELVADGAIADSAGLAAALSGLLGASAKRQRTAAAVSGHSVFVRPIVMPAMSDAELATAIQTEAVQHVPFPIEEVQLDYQVLDFREGGQMEVLLVAAKKEKIANTTEALTRAGLQPTIMDHDPLALANCYEYNYQPTPETAAALLHVGASQTHFNVMRGAVPCFTRDISAGGNQYTDALQKEFSLTFEEAEAVKLGRSSSVSESKRLEVMQTITEMLRRELRKMLDFFRTENGRIAIGQLYLSGGGARVAGLEEMLQQEMSVPVEWLDPFRRIRAEGELPAGNLQQIAPRMAVAVGLALREFEDL